MNLTEKLQQELENPKLSMNESVLLRCQAAAEYIHCGQFEAAQGVLGELWVGLGKRPILEGVNAVAAAEVLLQCGALSSGVGSAQNMKGVHETSKDLLSEAQRIFESANLPIKAAEAQSELAVCYWRLGAFDEARVVLDQAAISVGASNDELKARILIRRALIETWACRYHDALEVLIEAESFFKQLPDALKGRWHGHKGLVLRQLGVAENRTDYLDRAIIEFTAAIYHYDQSQNDRYSAVNLNNLAMLLFRVGRYQEAHGNLDRASAFFSNLNDAGTLAQVNETRARVFFAENRFDEAKAVIEKVVRDFEVGGEQSCLADALTIQATVMAKLGDNESSLAVFHRAIEIAANAGALENAGHASLSLIEEHGRDRLTELNAYTAYQRADEFLKGTQDAEDILRLRNCARIVMRRLMGTHIADSDFSLKRALRSYEARFIEAALSRSGGKISQAATMLGLSHQTLSNILKYRQKDLQNKRLPVTPRRRSIIRDSRSRQPRRKPVSILYVEHDKLLANKVKATLEREGFRVDVNADGMTGLNSLQSQTGYDMLIFESELNGIDGMELTRRARELQHRLQTPIIMFSSKDVEADSYRAGVSLFLHKPEEVAQLAGNIKRLLIDSR